MSDEELMRIAFADKRTVQEILRYIFELGEQKGRADATKEMDLTSVYAKGRADAIEEFVEKIDDYRSASDRDIYAMEMVREIAEQLKEQK